MFTTFREAIATKIGQRVGSDAEHPLVAVYDYHATVFDSGYPSVTFEPSDMISDYEDTISNLRQYAFRIMIHQEIENLTRSEGIERLMKIVDMLTDDFDKSNGLDGAADFVQAVPMEMGFYGQATKLTLFAEIKVTCIKSINIV